MRKSKRLVKLLSIITITFFMLSNILTPVWAGQLARNNTFAAPGIIDPFGPLDPGGWAGMKPDPQAGIQELAASLVPKKVPVDVKVSIV